MRKYFVKKCIGCSSEYYNKLITEEQFETLSNNYNIEIVILDNECKAILRSYCSVCTGVRYGKK